MLELEEEDLYEALKSLRRELAEENDVPPYVIFHDATLMQMVREQPANGAELHIAPEETSMIQRFAVILDPQGAPIMLLASTALPLMPTPELALLMFASFIALVFTGFPVAWILLAIV